MAPAAKSKNARATEANGLVSDSANLGKAREALDSAAAVAAGYWLSFVSLSAYLAVAIGAVTHRDLFLENQLTLPILSVPVPLSFFFGIAPLLYLMLHIHLLIQMKAASDNIREWRNLAIRKLLRPLDTKVTRRGVLEKLRLNLPNSLVVQMLVPSIPFRWSMTYILVGIAIVFSVVVAPIFVLFLIQFKFLAFQSELISWIHRLAIVIDIVLIAVLWPLIIRRRIQAWRRWISSLCATLALAAIAFSVLVASFPGEWIYPATGLGLRRALFEGDANEIRGVPSSWFSNRLVLNDQDFVDDDSLSKVKFFHSFAGRHLERAVFTRADLRQADFTAADLKGAVFNFARLQNPTFVCGFSGDEALDKSDFETCAELQNSSFFRAQLQGAFLTRAHLQGASFLRAQLQGAWLNEALLQGADLSRAQIQGGFVEDAQLQGATLLRTELQGASLRAAQLQGALLERAQLQGTILDEASVFGVTGLTARAVYLASAKNLHFDAGQSEVWDRVIKNYSTANHIAYLQELACNNVFVPSDTVLSYSLVGPGESNDFENNSAYEASPAPFVAEHILGDRGVLYSVALTRDERASAARSILARIEEGQCPDAMDISDQRKRQMRGWADWNRIK